MSTSNPAHEQGLSPADQTSLSRLFDPAAPEPDLCDNLGDFIGRWGRIAAAGFFSFGLLGGGVTAYAETGTSGGTSLPPRPSMDAQHLDLQGSIDMTAIPPLCSGYDPGGRWGLNVRTDGPKVSFSIGGAAPAQGIITKDGTFDVAGGFYDAEGHLGSKGGPVQVNYAGAQNGQSCSYISTMTLSPAADSVPIPPMAGAPALAEPPRAGWLLPLGLAMIAIGGAGGVLGLSVAAGGSDRGPNLPPLGEDPTEPPAGGRNLPPLGEDPTEPPAEPGPPPDDPPVDPPSRLNLPPLGEDPPDPPVPNLPPLGDDSDLFPEPPSPPADPDPVNHTGGEPSEFEGE